MESHMQEVLFFATVLSPIVTAIVELIKRVIPSISKNIVPLISLGVGLLIGAASFPFTEMEFMLRLWAGGFSGLAATGLYEIGSKVDYKRK